MWLRGNCAAHTHMRAYCRSFLFSFTAPHNSFVYLIEWIRYAWNRRFCQEGSNKFMNFNRFVSTYMDSETALRWFFLATANSVLQSLTPKPHDVSDDRRIRHKCFNAFSCGKRMKRQMKELPRLSWILGINGYETICFGHSPPSPFQRSIFSFFVFHFCVETTFRA